MRIPQIQPRSINHNRFYPVKRPHWRSPPYRMPSGAMVLPVARRSIMCESGFHKPFTRVIMGIPILVCARCGVRMAKGLIEGTYRKRELIETAQRAEQKHRESRVFIDNKTGQAISTNPQNKAQARALENAKKELYLRAWKRSQQYKRTKTGKLKYVGDRK